MERTSLNTNKNNVIQLSNDNQSFKCLDPEGVLEVAKTLESVLEAKPPYVSITNKGGKDELTRFVTREEYLQFFIEWAAETIFELIDIE